MVWYDPGNGSYTGSPKGSSVFVASRNWKSPIIYNNDWTKGSFLGRLYSILCQTFESSIRIHRFYCWNSHWYYKLKLLCDSTLKNLCLFFHRPSLHKSNHLTWMQFSFSNVANYIGRFCDLYLICTLNKNIITKVWTFALMFDSWKTVKYLCLEICDEGEGFQEARHLALFFITFIHNL